MDIDTSNGHPDMDYEQHKQTFRAFWLGAQILTAAVVLILILMAVTLL